MIQQFKPILICAAVVALATSLSTVAETDEATIEKIKAAVAHERRSEGDRARDRNRKPLETLQFFGLQDDMTVVELLPGGGWYSKILGPVLEEKGQLYLTIGAERVGEALAGKPGFGSTKVLPFDSANFSRPEGSRRFEPGEFKLDAKRVDMVLTFRNMHNITEKGRANLNAAVFTALKKGGRYGVIDHTRRHMQEDSGEVWRRMDPVQMIKEIEASGFEFVDYSTLHYRPDDELLYEVGRKTVTGNTDRFTLLFRKP